MHGVLGIKVELASAIQCAIEVTFKEGRPSWSIGHIDLDRSLARPNGGIGHQSY
jgi:hypothetical protein